MYEVVVTRSGIEVARKVFSTEESADEAAHLVRMTDICIYTDVSKVWKPLCNWSPDYADRQLLRSVWVGNMMAPIRFARAKSGSGLKEAKDWCAAHLG